MADLALLFVGFLGGMGWGMTLQEKLEKRRMAIRIENRIVVDAPFSSVQAEIIMKTLGELAESARQDIPDSCEALVPRGVIH